MRPLHRAALTLAALGAAALASAAQLNGTYTINPQGSGARNYTTFAAAITALKAGVSGPVRFLVTPNPYPESLSINPVKGASSINSVTFVAPGNPATIDARGARHGLVVNASSAHFRFKNLRVIGWGHIGIWLKGGVAPPLEDCTFEKLEVESTVITERDPYVVLAQYGSQIVFRDCVFRGTSFRTVDLFYGPCLLDRCELDGKGLAKEVLCFSRGRFTIRNCFIHSPRSHSSRGSCIEAYTPNSPCLIVNNTIVGNTGDAVQKLTGTPGRWDLCNTFKNNIVVNLGTGPAIEYLDRVTYPTTKLPPCVADHNCYYAATPTRTIWVTDAKRQTMFVGSLASFVAWQTKTPAVIPGGGVKGYERNSVESDPGLLSMTRPFDIHLKATSPVIDRGSSALVESFLPFPTNFRVTHDLDGDVRGWKPDIGADEIAARITGSGGTSPGSSHVLTLTAPRDGGRTYQVGSSFGTGPILIGWRPLGLAVDNLLILTVGAQWPHIFPGYRGTLDKNGNGQASIRLPQIPALIGQTIHSAFITSNSTAKFGIGAISTTYSLTVTK